MEGLSFVSAFVGFGLLFFFVVLPRAVKILANLLYPPNAASTSPDSGADGDSASAADGQCQTLREVSKK